MRMPRRLPVFAAITVATLIGLPMIALIVRSLVAGSVWPPSRAQAVFAALMLSIGTSAATLMFALLIGTPAAFALARVPFRGRWLANALVEIPIILPPAVAGLALLMAFGRRGLVGAWLADAGISLAFTTTGVILAQCFVAIPFYVRTARAAFERVDRDLEAAAMVDGSSGWGVFRHVTLPLAMPTLGAGAVMCWSRALGEFGATLMFAGSLRGRTQTMPLAIYALLETDTDGAVLLGTAFVVIAVAMLAGTSLAGRRTIPPM
jgi:molybdate transport system permease protein